MTASDGPAVPRSALIGRADVCSSRLPAAVKAVCDAASTVKNVPALRRLAIPRACLRRCRGKCRASPRSRTAISNGQNKRSILGVEIGGHIAGLSRVDPLLWHGAAGT